jgi:UDP-N-acetylmuramate dehydrogenase
MLGGIRGTVRFKETLSFYTALRTGGPADFFIAAQGVADVQHALSFVDRQQLPIVVLGGGNKVLVRDGGIRGVVLKLDGTLARAEFQGEDAMVGAGMGLAALVREAAARGLGGLEPLVGIPGTVGGALATNAGTADGWIGEHVSAVYFLYPDGSYHEYKPGMGPMTDRRLDMPANVVVVGCRLQFHARPAAMVQKDIKTRVKRKNMEQPLALASAGAVWKDPPSGLGAERLIAQSGLRSKRVGQAEISAKHANYIINRGGATAVEILDLMHFTRERVHAHTGVSLEEDIRILGE